MSFKRNNWMQGKSALREKENFSDDYNDADSEDRFSFQSTPKSHVCEICEEGIQASWSCLDCDQNLCEKCKNLHLKSRASMNCNVVSLSRREKYKVNENSCSFHPKETCKQFCKSCNKTICTRCTSAEHSRHSFVTLGEITQLKKKNIQRRLDRLRTFDIPQVRSRKQQTAKNQEEYSAIVQNLIHEVHKRHDMWKRKAEEIRDKVIQDIRKAEKEDNETMTKTKLEFETALEEMELTLENLEKEISVKAGKSCIKFCDDGERKLDRLVLPKRMETLRPPKLVTTSFVSSLMMRQFGFLEHQIRPTTANKTKSKPSILKAQTPSAPKTKVKCKSVTTVYMLQTNGTIYSVCPIGNRKAWIGVGHSDKSIRNGTLMLIDIDGNTTMTLKTDYNPLSLAITKSGNLLFCGGMSCKIVDFDNGGKISTFHDITAQIKGVHINMENDILLSYPKEEKVVKITSNGEILNTIKKDEKGKKIFESPLSIIENTNGDICVLNGGTNSNKGRELVVLEGNQIKFKYYGNTTIKSDKPTMNGLTCDKNSKILISDYHNNCVHMLDENGNFLKFAVTQDDGILCPEGIAIDSKGNLMVCSQKNLIYVENFY